MCLEIDTSPISSYQLKTLDSIDAQSLARECGWQLRSGGKISPQAWLRCLVEASAWGGTASLRTLAFALGGETSATLSKQAVGERMDASSLQYLQAVLLECIRAKTSVAADCLALFPRILLQDSTSIPLPGKLADLFPGMTSPHGRSATMKIQACYEQTTRSIEKLGLHPYTANDRTSNAEIGGLLSKGMLVLRDLGYFCSDSFRRIEHAEAFYLSRLHLNSVLSSTDGKPLDILEVLKAKGSFDDAVLLGGSRLKTRLVAIRATPEQAARRKRKLRQRNPNASRRLVELQEWSLYVTNIPAEMVESDKLGKLYGLRWEIENLFKSWKSGLKLDKIPSRASAAMAASLVLAGLIRATLMHARILPALERASPDAISLLKLASLLPLVDLAKPRSPAQQRLLIENLLRHSRYEKRKKPNMREAIEIINAMIP